MKEPGHADSYEGLVIDFKPGKKPHLIIEDDAGEELERIDRQDGGLAASEAELSARLWEVQETRRRHEASRTQLVAAISELEDELRRETDATGATDAKNGNGSV